MVTVALAGATTGLGLTFLHTFLHLNTNNQHKIVLLSRSEQPAFSAKGIDVRPVDYTNHSQLVQALKGVHTLLSLIGGAQLDAQLALLDAAKEAGVQRFAPSEYAGNGYEGVDMYQPKAIVWEAAKKSGLECARFNCGLFMSVLATGTPKDVTEVGRREGAKTGEEEALAGLRPWNFVLYMKAGTADFAGDGSAKMVVTDTRDVARFVWRALEMERWPQDLGMQGDVVSFRGLVGMLEEVQGRKFLVKENDLDGLLDEAAKEPQKAFYNQARVAIQKGWAMVGDDLNRAFPDVKPLKAQQFIERWWSGVKLDEPAWVDNRAFGQNDMDRRKSE